MRYKGYIHNIIVVEPPRHGEESKSFPAMSSTGQNFCYEGKYFWANLAEMQTILKFSLRADFLIWFSFLLRLYFRGIIVKYYTDKNVI